MMRKIDKMNKLIKCKDKDFFLVPDGTLVNPFLSSKDSTSGLPWDLLDEVSIAAGVIIPGKVSKIHVHPYITQITLLISGELKIHMKDPGTTDPRYVIDLKRPKSSSDAFGFTTAATLAKPGTFFQLDNSSGKKPAKVLYITSPSYIFEPGETTDAQPIYDDAITVGDDWEELANQNWNPPVLNDPSNSYAARQQASLRLASRIRSSEL
jgi:hypothetical protein